MRELFCKIEYHRISGILGSKGFIKRVKGVLGLFMGLRPMRLHAITHKDVCSLSSLEGRGGGGGGGGGEFLDIS